MSFIDLIFPYGHIANTAVQAVKGNVGGAISSYARSVPGVVVTQVAAKPLAYLGTGLVASFQKGAAASKTIALAPKIAKGLSAASKVWLAPAKKVGGVATQAVVRSTKALATEAVKQGTAFVKTATPVIKASLASAKTAVVGAFAKGATAASTAFATKTAIGLGGAKAAIAAGSAFLTGIGPVGWAVLGAAAIGAVTVAALAAQKGK